ncbi:hypothetical protein C0W35_21370 [Photobacterium kishitanii]|uniref:hypothetical protein n=1 Tax=Photobacterium kishitanii TaxID=318456 RepID=UPI000D16AA32|nr:hypothetical protein [Photobacterium kishitanii]PSU87553.1 hypothetical protein C0W35_21370 [Photobacterium kishitanii]
MINIKNKLIDLGVDSENFNKNIRLGSKIPANVALFLECYKHSILFNEQIAFSPKYKTNLENDAGTLTLEILWGLNKGNFNIFDANHSLRNIEADEDLFSIGSTAGDYHICISELNNAIYLFANGLRKPRYKLFDNYQEFFNSLHVVPDTIISPETTSKVISIKLDL